MYFAQVFGCPDIMVDRTASVSVQTRPHNATIVKQKQNRERVFSGLNSDQ